MNIFPSPDLFDRLLDEKAARRVRYEASRRGQKIRADILPARTEVPAETPQFLHRKLHEEIGDQERADLHLP